jgi:hypothetical protein
VFKYSIEGNPPARAHGTKRTDGYRKRIRVADNTKDTMRISMDGLAVDFVCCDSSPAQENSKPKITQLETEVKESLSLGTVELPVRRSTKMA